jgi:hypothetical protein
VGFVSILLIWIYLIGSNTAICWHVRLVRKTLRYTSLIASPSCNDSGEQSMPNTMLSPLFQQPDKVCFTDKSGEDRIAQFFGRHSLFGGNHNKYCLLYCTMNTSSCFPHVVHIHPHKTSGAAYRLSWIHRPISADQISSCNINTVEISQANCTCNCWFSGCSRRSRSTSRRNRSAHSAVTVPVMGSCILLGHSSSDRCHRRPG